MSELRFTLVTDGSSDRALLPILHWTLLEGGITAAMNGQWADLRRLPIRPGTLRERVACSVDLYPCDLLFVHRDAETVTREQRMIEIRAELLQSPGLTSLPHVCVVPVRMTEAWLLCDTAAIRRAAGNPSGTIPLALPRGDEAESLPDPKQRLFEVLRTASGLRRGRRRDLPVHELVHRVAELVRDWSPLRALPAFRALEADVAAFVTEHGARFQ